MSAGDRIRVLHVIDSLDLGGGQTALLNLLRATNRERFDPEIACMHGRGVFWEDFAQLGIPLHSLSPRKWLPLYLPRLVRLIRSRRFAIVHCHLFGANWIAKPLAAMLRVPVRISHDQCNDAVRHESRGALALDRLTNRWSSHICAVSKSTRDFLIEYEAIPPERVSLVYNAVDLARFAAVPRLPRNGRFAVLGIGRLHPQKNFALFLRVAQQLVSRGLDVEFRIAGTGPEEKELRALAQKPGLSGRVQFLGHVKDTPQLYAAADALLMTSRYEGTPLTMLEAMAMRVPVIAPDLDGIGEILVDGEDALLVRGDERQFAAAVERVLTQPQLASQLTAKAEEKVRSKFSAAAMAAQVEEIYECCLNAVAAAGAHTR